MSHANQHDEGYRFTFSGDLCQMSTQGNFLKDHGFDIGYLDVYPAVKTQKEFDAAIMLIWNQKVDGWWHYKEKLIARVLILNFKQFWKLHANIKKICICANRRRIR